MFKYTGKTKFVYVTESPVNKVVNEGVERLDKHIDTMKELPNWQLENFLVSLVKRAYEHDFQDHPFPNAAIREFICTHFEGGKP